MGVVTARVGAFTVVFARVVGHARVPSIWVSRSWLLQQLADERSG